MKTKIKLLAPMTLRGVDYVDNSECLSFTGVDKEAEVLYVHFTNIDLLASYPKLKFVLCPCTNVNHLTSVSLPILYLDNKEYLFENVWSTAEHTVNLMIQLTRHLKRQLKNATIGFIGYGRVAQQVRYLLSGFDIFAYSYDRNSTKLDLLNLTKNCDIITVHLEENKDTKRFIDKGFFWDCAKKPIFINTSRSSIVNPNDLYHAYKYGKIGAFGLDVVEDYTKTEIELLRSCPNSIVTPHIAGTSLPSREWTDLYVLQKLTNLIQGRG